MASVAVLLADGFEEIEAITIIDVLRRAGLDVRTLGVDTDTPTGSHKIQVRADARLDPNARFDAVILPGGMPGAATLRDHPGVRALLTAHAAEGRLLGAICAAPIALGAAGLLDGLPATCYPGFEGQLTGATLTAGDVVDAGPILTSRGPATALAFSLALVARLAGPEVAAKLGRGMLVGEHGA